MKVGSLVTRQHFAQRNFHVRLAPLAGSFSRGANEQRDERGMFILGIDAGGTAVKAAVYSLDGDELGVTSRIFRPIMPAPGHAERDPDLLWQGVCEVVKAACVHAGVSGKDIAAVGVTGYGNGLYLLDTAGRPVTNGVLSSDVRATEIVEQWRSDGLEEEEVALVGKGFWPGCSLSILGWFRRFRPDLLKRAAWGLPCKDYLRFRLTGAIAAELTDQSTASLVVNSDRGRDERVLALVGLADCARLLPQLIEPCSVAGVLSARAASETGLRRDTPVCAGCCDNLAVMYGTGAAEPGEVVVMSGTWGLHQVILDHAPQGGRISFVCHAATPGQWLCIDGSPASAGSLEWFVETFMRNRETDEPSDAAYKVASAMAAEITPDDPPIFFLPFLNGAFDDLHARGTLVGFSTWHRLGHAVRAVFEGVAFEHRRHFDRLAAVCGRPKRARFAGGPVRSPQWCEIFAAALQLTLDVPDGVEFGARGVAILAAAACGLFPHTGVAVRSMTSLSHTIEPKPLLEQLLEKRYAAYCQLHAALHEFWSK
jgi:L-xylulokinase